MSNLRHILSLTLGGCLLLAIASPALAQSDPAAATERRLGKLERDVREVRDIVLQARSTGQPVAVKDAGADPEVVALRTRLDDLDLTLRQMNGQIDVLNRDLDQARKEIAALKSAGDAAAALPGMANPGTPLVGASSPLVSEPPAPLQVTSQPSVEPSLKPLPKDTTPQPTPQPTPQLPLAVAAPVAEVKPAAMPKAVAAAGPSSAAMSYAKAKQMLLDGLYADASVALRDYVGRYGDTAANAPEARYWLGETLFVQDAYAEAAGSYISALRGWPATSWAPDAVVKLSLALIELKKPVDACNTLNEFARRFPKPAPALASRAASARIKAKCS